MVADHLLLRDAGPYQALPVCGNDHGASGKDKQFSTANLVDVEVRYAVLQGAGGDEDVVVAPEGIHVRGDGHEKVSAGLRQVSCHLGKLNVEADHDPYLHALEIHDQQFVSCDESVTLAAEQVRLPVRAGDITVTVDADGRVGDTHGRTLRRAEDRGGRTLPGE